MKTPKRIWKNNLRQPRSKTELPPISRPDGRLLVKTATLERFPNRTLHRRYLISFDCPEFTCVCPMSGFPDFAKITIRYVPDKYCVELKSLKLYLNHFRDQGIFHEDVANLILDDLIKLLDPWEIEVLADFNVRGNIKTVIRALHGKEKRGASRIIGWVPEIKNPSPHHPQ